MVTKKSWEDFRKTGLFLFINSILHAFGWAITIEVDENGKAIEGSAKPARVKFRGFDNELIEESHRRIGQYLKDNAEQLASESQTQL